MYMKILIYNNDYPGIGDFIYFSFILMYDLHKKFNCEIYYKHNIHLNYSDYINFISSFSDIFSIETDVCNKSYDIVITSKDTFKKISMYNIKYNQIYFYRYGKLFICNQKILDYYNMKLDNKCFENIHQYIKNKLFKYNQKYISLQKILDNYNMKLDNKCFENIHQYMKNKFVTRNKFNLKKNTITISIGTRCQRFQALTDKGFQKIISKIIENNKNIQFCIIGSSNEIISDEFKYCLQKNHPHVLNLINKDDGLLDVIDIIQSSKIFVIRCSGLKHMAGLFNSNIICLQCYDKHKYSHTRYHLTKDFFCFLFKYLFDTLLLLINRFVFNHDPPHKNIITYSVQNEETHPYYYETLAPISLNYVRIIEIKRFDYFYNNFDYVYFYLLKAIQSVNNS